MLTDPAPLSVNQAGPPRLSLRPKDARKALGIGATLLGELTKAGTIPSVKLGRATVYPVAMLEAWLAEQAGKGARP